MPYYRWRGVSLQANILTSLSFARSEQELDKFLFDQDIALSTCSLVSREVRRGISSTTLIMICKQLGSLLDAGPNIPQALYILYKQLPLGTAKELIFSLYGDIQEGQSLTAAMQHYPLIFNSMVISMVQIGEQTGAISPVLKTLVSYLESKNIYKRKLMQALLVPILTFSFFIMIAIGILVLLVPQFQDVFKSLGTAIPVSTHLLISISGFVRSYWHILLLGLLFIFLWLHRACVRANISVYLGMIPFVRNIILYSDIMHTMESLALLLGNGMPLVQAMNLAQLIICNKKTRMQFTAATRAVTSGYALHTALAVYTKSFAIESIVMLLGLGQEAGQLGHSLTSIAHMYREKIDHQLSLVTMLIQPLCLLLLGLLITSMIIAIYMPIFNLAQIA